VSICKKNFAWHDDGSQAFTLIEIMIVMAILGMLLAMVIPYYVRDRAVAQATTCISNLILIHEAETQFALEKRRKSGDPINFPADLLPYIKLTLKGQIPPCPANGAYSINIVGTNPICSLGSSVNPGHLMP
jgi:prepilin-type N-terminal cleavage/methylation domain-containing protein